MTASALRRAIRLTLPRVGLLALGLVAAALLAEIVLRIGRFAPSEGLGTVTEAEFDRIPGLFRPGQRLLDRRNPQLPHRVSIDSLGFRGDPFPRRSAPGELRVLMVGDSFTFGDFVNDGETLPAQLERALRRTCGRVRVINAGVGGTSIVTHRAMVGRSLELDPDLVVLTSTENDVSDLALTPAWDRLAANRRSKSRFPLSVAYPVLRRTALWSFALGIRARLLNARRERVTAADVGRETVRTDSIRAGLRDRYARELAALRDSLASAGLALAFAVYPSHLALENGDSAGRVSWAVATGREAGLPTFDITAALQGPDPATAFYLLPHDGHPSPAGYRVAARYLAEGLQTASLLPDCGASSSLARPDSSSR